MDKQEQYMQKYMDAMQAFNKTPTDIPADAQLKQTVRNRPYITFIIICAVLAFFAAVIPSARLVLCIMIAIILVIMMLIHNRPILEIYDSFLVLYNYMDGKDNPKIAIINNEDLVSWDSKSTIGYNTMFKYNTGEGQKAIGLNSVNFQGCNTAMNKYYHNKLDSLVKLNEYKKEMSKSNVSFGQAVKSLIKLNEDSKKAEKENSK